MHAIHAEHKIMRLFAMCAHYNASALAFYDRIVNIWNDIDNKIIESENENIFKKHYDDINNCK